MRSPFLLHSMAALAVIFCLAQAAAQQQSNPDDPDRKQAFNLFDQHKLSEAVPLLEKVAAKYPSDLVAQEHLGVALINRSATWTEPEKRKADRLAARAALLRAKKLGDDSPLCNVLLKELPEDGSEAPFSDRSEVDAAIKRGEAAFAKGDLEAALKEYTLAFTLDPKLYAAALYIGDTYYRMKQTDQAGEWFARATQIDPDRETAYRYWGDALMADSRMKEARTKFIEAVVAWPYQQIAWDGLNQWVKRNKLRYKDVSIDLPKAPTTDAKGNTNITIDAGGLENNGGAAWLMYSMERALWRDKFAKEFPQEKAYRHTLKEEVDALSVTASVYQETGNENSKAKKKKKSKPSAPDPQLELLVKLKTANMLEPFVLLLHPDQDIIKDYAPYQAAHRDKLIEFMDKYLVPEAP